MKLSRKQVEKLQYLLNTIKSDFETLEISKDIKNNEMLIFTKKNNKSIVDYFYWSYLNQNWEKR